ncbi:MULTISPECIES: thiol reductant ABC exporter subunit CydC [unclassified Thioalkalivibrio]|uniref:thiol reductant ABC exporter subunit CydC n=1 Tax=unclassified Thioalkalivibrio TaxID=2621013 RepID=UPI0003798399|nr:MULTISPECIES: thiol reductant ABC exporter subunit CydC [unclassified Thioalkalivibrio]
MRDGTRAKLAFLHRVFRQRRAWYWGAWGLLALTWIAGIALLALSGWFITATALAGAGLLATLDLYVPSGGIRTAAISRTLARYFERLVSHEAVLRSLADLRGHSFRGLAALPMERIRAYRSGDLQTRLTGDIDTLDAMPLRVVGPMIAAAISLVVTLVIAVWLAPWPAAVVLAASGVATLAVSGLLALAGQRRSHALVQARARERVGLFDYIGGLAELLAYDRAREHEAVLRQDNDAYARRQRAQEAFGVGSEQLVQAVVGTAALLMLVLALGWYRDGALSAPVAVLLPLMTLGLGEVLGSLPGAWWRAGESLEAAGRVQHLETTAQNPAPVERPDPTPADEVPALRAHRMIIGFRRERPLLGPLDLEPVRGHPLVISGASGRGKSTLLDTLAGEMPPLGGTVLLGDDDLQRITVDSRYRHISYLPQGLQLPDTALRSILSPNHTPLSDAALWEALEQVDLAEAVRSTDEGLDYRIGEGGSYLSGGQRRRLALAAVVLQDRPVVLLDEPFSGLDTPTQQRVVERLLPWLQDRQCILVTHAPEQLPASWPRLEIAKPLGRS